MYPIEKSHTHVKSGKKEISANFMLIAPILSPPFGWIIIAVIPFAVTQIPIC